MLKHGKYGLLFLPLGFEKVYLPLWKMADTPFHNQGDDLWLDTMAYE